MVYTPTDNCKRVTKTSVKTWIAKKEGDAHVGGFLSPTPAPRRRPPREAAPDEFEEAAVKDLPVIKGRKMHVVKMGKLKRVDDELVVVENETEEPSSSCRRTLSARTSSSSPPPLLRARIRREPSAATRTGLDERVR